MTRDPNGVASEPPPQPASRVAADLSNCDREPIHIPGAIQPHGGLIACRMADWIVEHASTNLSAILGRAPEAAIGRGLDALFPAELVHDLRNLLQTAMATGSAERLADVAIGATRFDASIHAVGARAIVELVPRAHTVGGGDPHVLVKGMVGRLRRAPDLDRFLRLAANQVRAVTGFDRVMIYKFLHDDTGEVVAETAAAGMERWLGLRYPASDIPAQARALYRRQWLRLIPDVDYAPAPLAPPCDRDGTPLDLSLAGLRSVSPIHLEYLRNMGAAATLTVSILRGDELWGLIACHHRKPRALPAETLAACELFGQIFSIQIEAKEAQLLAADQARSRLAHDRLMAGMSLEETIFDNLATFAPTLMDLIACDGIGIWSDGRFTGHGIVPPTEGVAAIVGLLSAAPLDRPVAEDTLAARIPGAAAWADRVSGVLSIGFSRSPRDYLMFFRREVVQSVAWGGDPTKPVEPTASDGRLHPRKSFAAWHEEVRGRALPWTAIDIDAAATLRVSLLEVILRRADLLADERRSAQESQALLIAELNHRVKNALALIRSLVRQSRQGASSVQQFTGDLESRIRSLALAHDQLAQIGWRGAPLRGLLEAEVEAWSPAAAGRDRVELTGPSVSLDARAYQAMALVFHELATNAAKYGALSRAAGRVAIEWQLDDAGALHVDWREHGGPAVQAPSRRGFGSVVVERTVPFELRGEARIEYRLEGVHAAFRIPAEHVALVATDPDATELPAPPPPPLSLHGRRVLLVEDSMMIALDAQAMLADAGAEVDVAGNVADARRALAAAMPDLAVLDVNLTAETSFPVADALLAAGTPFIFATGYGESVAIPPRFADVPVATKPYDETNLATALAALSRH